MSSLYFDNASTTFPSENSVKVFNATLTQFHGNPSSSHKLGEEAFKCLTQAREQVASLLCTDEPSSVVFTSSATEANNIVMQGLIEDVLSYQMPNIQALPKTKQFWNAAVLKLLRLKQNTAL